MHNREIVSFNISTTPNFEQTKDMLNKAFEKYDNLNNLIFHLDQSWQYQMESYHKMLKKKGVQQKLSRQFANGKLFWKDENEMFYGYEYTFETLDDLKIAMEEYIDYYNNQRITVKLKGLTPVQYRNKSLLTA